MMLRMNIRNLYSGCGMDVSFQEIHVFLSQFDYITCVYEENTTIGHWRF